MSQGELEVIKGAPVQEVTPDLAYKRLGIVNVVFYGRPDGPWVLIDAGLERLVPSYDLNWEQLAAMVRRSRPECPRCSSRTPPTTARS